VLGAEVTTVADSARHLDVSAGPDDHDRFSLPPSGVTYERAIESLDLAGLRAAWTADMGFAAPDPEVGEIAGAAATELMAAAGLVEVDRPLQLTDPVKTWMSAGGLTLWLGIERKQHWPERADELTPFVRMGLEATADRPIPTLDSVYRRRWQLEAEVAEIFEDVDVLLAPTTAVVAFPAEGPLPRDDGGIEVPYTMLANLCWNPACSVPAGLNSEGLPVGLQIIGPRHRDDLVLRLARIWEQTRPWPRLAPIS
jgi:aspartyl-tRNA(Asn)/glutamyl-tRNA(Gln) amidotransferase subunit A